MKMALFMQPRIQNPKLAVIDIGTNAVRLLAVEFTGQHKYKTISDLRLPVRLGENMYGSKIISRSAMQRAASACRRIARLSRKLGITRMVAVITAAGREARNAGELVGKIRSGAGITPVILSSHREAKLVYAGVTGGIRPGRKSILAVEIGGGSTELAAGQGNKCERAMALSIGAVKMKHLYPATGGEAPLPEPEYCRMVAMLEKKLRPRLKSLAGRRYGMALGSAGTVRAMADIIARFSRNPAKPPDKISSRQVRNAARMLCALPLAQRKRLLEIQPDRADIILGGAAILEALMGILKIRSIRVSRNGLREGLVLEAYPALAAGNKSL